MKRKLINTIVKIILILMVVTCTSYAPREITRLNASYKNNGAEVFGWMDNSILVESLWAELIGMWVLYLFGIVIVAVVINEYFKILNKEKDKPGL